MKRVCVFCGSSAGHRAEYRAAAAETGRELARRRIGLVYGGSRVGLMRVVAEAALAAGGEVIGVIPRSLVEREVAHLGVTELRVVDTMHERKALMADLSDGFIAMPGGLGTLDELFEIMSWASLRLHMKPCGVLNVAAYFDGLLRFVGHAVVEGFIEPEHGAMLFAADTPAALLDSFANYEAPAVDKAKRALQLPGG
ncbi:MAG: TIGR00730 family Rossman fold protein [Bryobacteraceae bacterium]|nr:TIGR00730 family Rossman fold protein [Bryobacteraceae bacterium]